MPHWPSSSKVRLGLLVNALYMLSLFLPSHSQVGGRPYVHTYERRAGRLRADSPPDYAPLPPYQAETLKADAYHWRQSGQTDVYLTRELTLVRKRGHTLLLSPTFAMKAHEPPRSVILSFISFSHEQFYDRNSPFVITADGTELWRYGWRGAGDETPSSGRALHTAALDANGQVVETLGHEIPFDIFFGLLGARRVTIELGPDRVELTPEQMEALRDMYRPLPRQTPQSRERGAGKR